MAVVVAPVRRAARGCSAAHARDAPATRPARRVPLPAGYVIGPDDVLTIVFWRDKDMSADVVVRPDGKISLPLLNDVQAAGLTPEQLRAQLDEGGGEVRRGPERDRGRQGDQQPQGVHHRARSAKPGTYPLDRRHDRAAADRAWPAARRSTRTRRTSSSCGTRTGSSSRFKFNYKDVVKRKNVAAEHRAEAGDTVIVP